MKFVNLFLSSSNCAVLLRDVKDTCVAVYIGTLTTPATDYQISDFFAAVKCLNSHSVVPSPQSPL